MATFCKFSVESAMDEIEKLKGTKRDHEKKKGIVYCINFLYAKMSPYRARHRHD